MRFARSRFTDLVARQLDLFTEDSSALLEDARTADRAWTDASREDAEELYGDYQLVVDAIGERLYDAREAYAATLDPELGDAYRSEFDRSARKRFPRYADLLGDGS
jgi:hypothetical protein